MNTIVMKRVIGYKAPNRPRLRSPSHTPAPPMSPPMQAASETAYLSSSMDFIPTVPRNFLIPMPKRIIESSVFISSDLAVRCGKLALVNPSVMIIEIRQNPYRLCRQPWMSFYHTRALKSCLYAISANWSLTARRTRQAQAARNAVWSAATKKISRNAHAVMIFTSVLTCMTPRRVSRVGHCYPLTLT